MRLLTFQKMYLSWQIGYENDTGTIIPAYQLSPPTLLSHFSQRKLKGPSHFGGSNRLQMAAVLSRIWPGFG